MDVPDVFTQAFVIEKDGKRFPKSGGWGYALFNYEAASDKFTADPSPSDCGHACHVAVKAKDHSMLVDIWIAMARPALELVTPHLRPGAIVVCAIPACARRTGWSIARRARRSS